MQKTVSLHTLGCKLNYSETSTIAGQFREKGYSVTNHGNPSDVFVLNTCSVTENADRECRQIIRSVIRRNPETYVIVTGCYAQLQPGEVASIEGVDLVLGASEKFRLFDYIGNLEKNDVSCIFRTPPESITGIDAAYSADEDSRTRAFLKIQDGCDYKCSFCTIPLARGRSRSLPLNEIIENAKKLIDFGYREIVVTGVNTGDYYHDGNKLFDVLHALERLGVDRIRVSSIEPNLLTNEIIQLVAGSDRFCKHFHIPLQSGDDKILGLMRRRYNTQQYRQLINNIREQIPEAGIGADVMTGFPGESPEIFENTFRFIESLDVSYLHVFTYSERRDTDAALMKGRVDVAERRKRNEMLRNLSQNKRKSFMDKFAGSKARVLFESARSDGTVSGYTSNYIRVLANQPGLENRIADVKLTSRISEDKMECRLPEAEVAIL